MAVRYYAASDAEAMKVWAKELEHETIQRTFLKKFLGTGRASMFQERTDLSKGKGDQITTILRANLTGDGISGDGQVEGNEESLQTFTDAMVINSLDHAVRTPTDNTISIQRIPVSLAEEAKDALADWWSVRLNYGPLAA